MMVAGIALVVGGLLLIIATQPAVADDRMRPGTCAG